MQPALENALHRGGMQGLMYLLSLTEHLYRSVAADPQEMLIDPADAGVERPRHVSAHDQELRDLEGCDHVAIDLAIAFKGADRVQQRPPLIIIHRAADILYIGL